MQLRTPEGPKQKQRASLLVPKSKTSTKRRGANSGRKGGGKRRLVDYSDSEDSYMAELDQIVLTDESDNEEILNLNTNAGNVIEVHNSFTTIINVAFLITNIINVARKCSLIRYMQ